MDEVTYQAVFTAELIPEKMSVKISNQKELILEVLRSFPICDEDFIYIPQSKFQELILSYMKKVIPDFDYLDMHERFKKFSEYLGISRKKVERYYYSAFKSSKSSKKMLLRRVIQITNLPVSVLRKYGKIEGKHITFKDQETFRKLIDERIEKQFKGLSKRAALKKIAELSNLSINTVNMYYYQYFKGKDKESSKRGIKIKVAKLLTGLDVKELLKVGKVDINLKHRAEKLASMVGIDSKTILLFWMRDEGSPSFSRMNFKSLKICFDILGKDLSKSWDELSFGFGGNYFKLPKYYVFDEPLSELCGLLYSNKIRGSHILVTNTNLQVLKMILDKLRSFARNYFKVSLYLHVPSNRGYDVESIKKEWVSFLGIEDGSVSLVTKGLHFTKKVAGQLVVYMMPEAYILSNLIKMSKSLLMESPKSVKEAFIRGYTEVKGTVSQSSIVLTTGRDLERTKFIHELLEDIGYENKIVINKHFLRGEIKLDEKVEIKTRTISCSLELKRTNSKNVYKVNLRSWHTVTGNPYEVDLFYIECDGKKYEFKVDSSNFSTEVEIPKKIDDLKFSVVKVMQYQVRMNKDTSLKFLSNINIRNKYLREKFSKSVSGKNLTQTSIEILRLIEKKPGITSKEIAKELGRHIVYVRQKLTILKRIGLIISNKKRSSKYIVSKEGLEFLKGVSDLTVRENLNFLENL
ncbi:MAG: hypothetical protein ACTSYT_05670 [Candidatus Asgardarchaeia archaeon]